MCELRWGYRMEQRGEVFLLAKKDFHQELARNIQLGLTSHPKWFPTKYLYDEKGTVLYEKIVLDPIYYLYQAETEILQSQANEIMQLTRPDEVVEIGSGTSTKTRLLLEAMHSFECNRYVPIDISKSTLRHAAENLKAGYAWLHVEAYVGDFDTDLPNLRRNGRRLIVFLGNTVGNFRSKYDRIEFLKNVSATMEPGDALLLGIDLFKDKKDILAGYADTKGFREQFYMRALSVMNNELGANFVEESFSTISTWNSLSSALEISLVSLEDSQVYVKDLQLKVSFSKGESFLIASSTKFTKIGITMELTEVGLDVIAWYMDESKQFADLLAVRQP